MHSLPIPHRNENAKKLIAIGITAILLISIGVILSIHPYSPYGSSGFSIQPNPQTMILSVGQDNHVNFTIHTARFNRGLLNVSINTNPEASFVITPWQGPLQPGDHNVTLIIKVSSSQCSDPRTGNLYPCFDSGYFILTPVWTPL